jgi:hypothetical protein
MDIISREEAKAKGLKRYFTGAACRNSHVAERYTCSGKCCQCNVSSMARYRSKNRQKYNVHQRAYLARLSARRRVEEHHV